MRVHWTHRSSQTAAGNTLWRQVDAEGNIRYDAIAQQGHSKNRIIRSQFKDLVALHRRTDVSDEQRTM